MASSNNSPLHTQAGTLRRTAQGDSPRLVGHLSLERYIAVSPDETPEAFAVAQVLVEKPLSVPHLARWILARAKEADFPLCHGEVLFAIRAAIKAGHYEFAKTGGFPAHIVSKGLADPVVDMATMVDRNPAVPLLIVTPEDPKDEPVAVWNYVERGGWILGRISGTKASGSGTMTLTWIDRVHVLAWVSIADPAFMFCPHQLPPVYTKALRDARALIKGFPREASAGI